MSDPLTNATPAPEPIAPEPAPAAPAEPDWLPARLERAKKSAANELLGTLGVDSVDSAKALLEEAARLKAEQMTEAERERARAEESARKVAELESAIAARDLADEKRRILASAKLPENLADILRGDTAEQFGDSVKAYLATNPASPDPLPPAAGTSTPPSPPLTPAQVEGMSYEERRAFYASDAGREWLAAHS